MLGSKVMNKNVRQGFCCWRKSLIFCRGIFRMKKLLFFFNNVLENTSNHLKIGINHPKNGFKKFLTQIFEILIFRDFSHLWKWKNGLFSRFLPSGSAAEAIKLRKIKISKICIRKLFKMPQRSFLQIFKWFQAFSRKFKGFPCEN